MSIEDRLVRIETKIAFNEDLVQTLNETIVAQQRQLTELEIRCQNLLDRLGALSAPADAPPADERPPHF